MPLLSARFLALPVIALAVIVGLAQAQSDTGSRETVVGPSVLRAVNCAMPSNATNATCAWAGNSGAAIVR